MSLKVFLYFVFIEKIILKCEEGCIKCKITSGVEDEDNSIC